MSRIPMKREPPQIGPWRCQGCAWQRDLGEDGYGCAEPRIAGFKNKGGTGPRLVGAMTAAAPEWCPRLPADPAARQAYWETVVGHRREATA